VFVAFADQRVGCVEIDPLAYYLVEASSQLMSDGEKVL